MSSEPAERVVIPYTELTEELLLAVAESFVLREGTDYGERELTLEEKTARLIARLKSGDFQIVFDPESQSVTILPKGGATG